jgi:hypothetical protein
MKYPASRIIGGSMYRKNTSGVKVDGGWSVVRKRRNPIRIPTTIRRLIGGKIHKVFQQAQFFIIKF